MAQVQIMEPFTTDFMISEIVLEGFCTLNMKTHNENLATVLFVYDRGKYSYSDNPNRLRMPGIPENTSL